MKRHNGFTMIEMTIVLIMIGLLTAAIAPLLMNQHTNSMEERDRVALTNAKMAIINYAESFGGIPNPQGVTGILLATGVGQMPPVTGGLNPIPALGVNNWGAFGSSTTTPGINTINPFQMDVNDKLRSSVITAAAVLVNVPPKVYFCQSVNYQLTIANATPPTKPDNATSYLGYFNGSNNPSPGLSGPRVCQNTASNRSADVNDPICTVASVAVPTTSVPVAFVIFSTGNNRIADLANSGSQGSPLVAINTAPPAYDRFYENDTRGINNSNNVPGHYDDQLMSYSLSAFASDCQQKMNVLPAVMACQPGQMAVAITNSSGATAYYKDATLGTCVQLPASSASSITACESATAAVTIYSDNACGIPYAISSNQGNAVPNTNGMINANITGAVPFTLY